MQVFFRQYNYCAKLADSSTENEMEHHIFMTALIFIAGIVAFGAAYYCYKKDNFRFALVWIIAAGFLWRLDCALDPQLHQWDERFHALVAKNVMEDPFAPKLYSRVPLDYDYQHWGNNHIWLHKQPLPFWVMGGSMKIFGLSPLALRLPALVMSTLLIWFTFLIGSKLFDQRIGLLAAFFHAINGMVIEIGSGRVATDHVDIFFFFFIELAILLAVLYREKPLIRYLLLVGVFTGMALLCKWLPGLIVIPVFIILNFNRENGILPLMKAVLIITVAMVVVVLPWQVYAARNFPLEYWWENGYNLKHLTHSVETHGKPWWYHLANMGRIWNEMIYVALPWFLWKTLKKGWNAANYTLLAWIVIPYLVFSLAATKMQGYVLFTGPAFFLILAWFIFELQYLAKQDRNFWVKWFYHGGMAVILLLAFRFGLERVKPFQEQEEGYKLQSALMKLEDQVDKESSIIFNTPRYIECMFFTRHLAYEKIPSKEEVNRLLFSGEKVFVIDDNHLPEYLRHNAKVVKIDEQLLESKQ